MTRVWSFTRTQEQTTVEISVVADAIQGIPTTPMETSRPRPSILTLFDPLSERSTSPDSDKENNTSLFTIEPPPAPSPYVPKKRLVDVGDISIDDAFSNSKLLFDEEELEVVLTKDLLQHEENDTLTFRDMVKAATPKWSAQRPTRSSPFSPQSRSPLAEIHTRVEATPMARRHPLSIVTTSPTLPKSSPFHRPTFSEPTGLLQCSQERLGESVCTVDLSASTASTVSLLTRTSLTGLDAAPDQGAFESTPPSSHLRPPRPTNDNYRQSMDLHSSFHLHMSSEPVFDLLNDKVSFLSSQHGDSFNTEDLSFDFGPPQSSLPVAIPQTPIKADLEPVVPDQLITSDVKDEIRAGSHGKPILAFKQSSVAQVLF